jgi:NADP-dependent aldehyde dehydrogenase
MTDVVSIDPRTGETIDAVASESSSEDVDDVCVAAQAAAAGLEDLGRAGRAAMLRTMAGGLEAHGDDIVRLADRETAVGSQRLSVELKRTCFQLRLFADVLEDGGYLEASIDHAGETPMGPRPDLRRMLVPIGPVAVFGASNFPLAFSVPGGDTASALAAGCPVVIKAHASHPATSELCFEVLKDSGPPEGSVALVHGLQGGAALVAHPAIQAVGFTGSLAGGNALMEIIAKRPQPIPFYGELSSRNPVVITEEAAATRADDIGSGLVASFTVGGGQLCTKPGLVFVPRSSAGDDVVASMIAALADVPDQVMLNERICSAYASETATLRSELRILHERPAPAGDGYRGGAHLAEIDASAFGADVLRERFGPAAILVRYAGSDELRQLLVRLPGSLTGTIHGTEEDVELVQELSVILRSRAGRLIYDGYPTGVAVAWAQHHGGPWPSTNSLHTSVGPTAIRRFLRPVAWQDAPEHVLPAELRDDDLDLPRRVDGRLQPGGPG